MDLYIQELEIFIPKSSFSAKDQKEELDLPSFDLATIVFAIDTQEQTRTMRFWNRVLKDGQEITMERSGGGLDEFKNEVIHMAKLQHQNLMKLLRCCIQADVKILVY
ncbi:hypothetical protein GOBAR_AA22314 [Gossypium barbadense]|uniref:Serine-threonine/tyrosine-protein kinase catalytic domain-containing protein n=1 Tax=Gossypium barbadense TaxID=3634 RepID=A0A2P5X4U7_GOSBA|nr:hypothetical protein GOBAR_AA22314 [Gossypium barbadense]